MNKWLIDVPVLCIFFARPKQFEKCFEQVRKARPRVLLLWQDGPREGRADDVENIMKCREIAENIDWECEVHRMYNEKNYGCDPSTHYSHKWAFSIVDKCIILEDDLVASQSFFTFCKDMLDKYEFDTRIDRICGTNLLGKYDIPYDYFFVDGGNSWGWATWKRVADEWESDYAFLDEDYAVNGIINLSKNPKRQERWVERCKEHRRKGIPYWEYVCSATSTLNHRLCIYPRVNMISNVGLSANSTHAPERLDLLPKLVRQYFNTEIYELTSPYKHPKYLFADVVFKQKCNLKIKGTRWQRFLMFFERILLKLKKR